MRIINHQIRENAQRPKSAKWNTLISSRKNGGYISRNVCSSIVRNGQTLQLAITAV
jgi:hypothetical protein